MKQWHPAEALCAPSTPDPRYLNGAPPGGRPAVVLPLGAIEPDSSTRAVA